MDLRNHLKFEINWCENIVRQLSILITSSFLNSPMENNAKRQNIPENEAIMVSHWSDE